MIEWKVDDGFVLLSDDGTVMLCDINEKLGVAADAVILSQRQQMAMV